MSTRAPSHDRLAEMADDIRQLVEPITMPISQRVKGRTQWSAIKHLCLLDQLREAIQPGGGTRGPERRSMPESRPPVRVDAVDKLSSIYVELAGWHASLNLPSPPRDTDWQKTALRQLVGAVANLAPSIADQLAGDVHGWWRKAARATGWNPDHLTEVR